MKIDAHQHFWKFDATRDSWITEDMKALRRDFLPADSWQEMKAVGIDGCVAIQADQSEAETDFLLSLASQHRFIKGVVGWIDLQSVDIEDRLQAYASSKVKGFRHILQGENNRALMLSKRFMNGISKLERFGYTYDILILPDQLPYVSSLAKAFPNQKFVVDHLAKPFVRKGELEPWRTDIQKAAEQENVSCKISGLATEANWKEWSLLELRPYLDIVWEAFGAKRVMFGSDYPVCLLAGGYQFWVNALEEYTIGLSADEKQDFWGGNASRFYGL